MAAVSKTQDLLYFGECLQHQTPSCLHFLLLASLLTSAWCHSRKVEAAEKHPGDGSRGHLPEQNFRELHR